MKTYKILPVILLAGLLAGCANLQNLIQPKSPTRTLENFVEASQKKDVEGVKKSLSANSLKMMDNLAKMQGKTLEQTIQEGDTTGGANSFARTPESRNEKITDNTATLEVKNEKTAEWETLHFVKEGEEWKIALDKSIEEMYKKVFENFKLPDFGDSDSATDEPSSADEKKP
jgi:small-conductance mechanosensitive channel